MNLKPFSSIYLFYLALCALTVPLIIQIFTHVQPKNVAAVCASSTFVLLSLIIIFMEFKKKQNKIICSYSFWGAFVFLTLFSLPMLLIRVLHFNTPFEELKILFLPAPVFHKMANYGFILMVVLIIIQWTRTTILAQRKSNSVRKI